MMPRQRPGSSRQDFVTPDDFTWAVKLYLGISEFAADLAASPANTKAAFYFDEAVDSLKQCWAGFVGWCWLNPPFRRIAAWARKCANADAFIAFLVPASVGSNWFRDYVAGKALVLFISGRLSFDGKGPYPKDCMLCLYGPEPGYRIWDWRKTLAEAA